MSDLGNFADLANVRVADVQPPTVLPPGHYKCVFTGLMKPHKAKSGNAAMRFPFRPIEAGDDVDPEALEAAGGLPILDGSGREKEFAYDFWMSMDARYRFTDFGKALGHSDQLNLLELAEAIGTSGAPFTLELRHEYQKDTQGNDDLSKPPFMRWDNPAPAA